jgi:hypothetical protein
VRSPSQRIIVVVLELAARLDDKHENDGEFDDEF